MHHPIALRCRCGQVQGTLDPAGHYTRATCYCRDCQAWARWLGAPGLLDDAGGTDIVATAPSRVRFTAGMHHLACATLSGRVLRWYADCCRTPLGNTPAKADVHYVGLCTAAMPDARVLDAAFGTEGRCVINTGSATAPVSPTPFAFATQGLRIVRGILWARLRGRRDSPYFDADGQPVRTPERVA